MDKYKVKVDRWGARYWLLNGKIHRDGEPAIEPHETKDPATINMILKFWKDENADYE